MNEPYSCPLSKPAAEALTDWIDAYVQSLKSSHADHLAGVAKEKAITLLRDTDIDILVFVTAIATMHTQHGTELLYGAVSGRVWSRDVAIALVRIMQEAFRRDKQSRLRMG